VARPDAPRPAAALPEPPSVADAPVAAPAPVAAAVPAPTLVRPAAAAANVSAPAPIAAAPVNEPVEPRDDGNEGIVHRRLIRATLPKVEGAERDPRPIPVFTVHEAANARGKFRRFPRPAGHGHGQGGNGNGNGNTMPRFGHGGQPSPFSAQGRGPGKSGGQHANRGGGQPGNRANQQQRRGNKGR
jgi:hypothetical protein